MFFCNGTLRCFEKWILAVEILQIRSEALLLYSRNVGPTVPF